MAKNKTSADPADLKFGAFKGVFTPSILTILGVIMYLRFGWVVGNGGLVGAVLVVLLAHTISLTTGMSICSIATNRTVKVGGDYYMISRGLGLPIGGAIGLALFFALSLSMSLYLIGFAESFLGAFGMENTPLNRRIVGTVSCVGLTAVTFFSTSLALRVQYLVLAAIVLSLVSLFLGQGPILSSREVPLWFGPDAESFETVFAVFFPAVTGFTAGVAMSGDLKDPRKAIPRGTMAAILVGLAVYLTIPVFLLYKVDLGTLRTNDMIWLKVARVPELVIAGVFAATLSSALGSVLGAPRYLQALSYDRVVPRFMGKGYGALNEPRVGTVITFLVAEAGILVGELNLIARIITMFFLTSYGFLCLAAGIQKWSGVMSFRPEFRTPVWVSLLGALVCLGVMFKLDMAAMAAATVVMGMIFLVLKKRQLASSPRDTWRGFWAAVVQTGIMHLHKRAVDPKNWRPNLVVFGGDPSERRYLIDLARWIVRQRGLATYFHILEGDVRLIYHRVQKLEPGLRDTVGRLYPEMLARATVAGDVYDGILNTTQSYGLSGMTPNTVLMGWGDETEHPAKFTELIRGLLAMDHNLLLVQHDEARGFGNHRTIDIWWGGKERNSTLMLLIAYLVTASDKWSRAKVRVNIIVDNAERVAKSAVSLARVLDDARIPAEKNIIVKASETQTVADIMAETSADTDLVVIGLREPFADEGESYVAHVNTFIERLGTVLMVRASSRFDGAGVLFDDE
jgi:amino acid transporter